MKLINNYLLVHVPPPTFKTEGGFDFGLTKLSDVRNWRNAFEHMSHMGEPINPESEYSPTRGVIVETNECSELRKDDQVFFHKNATLQGIASKENPTPTIWFNPDTNMMLIREDECFVGLRGEEIIPLNGFVLLKQAPVELAKRVFYVERDEDCMAMIARDGHGFTAGQLVVPSRNWNVPLERETTTALPKGYFRIEHEYIHALCT